MTLSLPTLLSHRLEEYLRSSWANVEAQLEHVKLAAERYERLTYPRDTPAFAYLYFGANFAKAFRAAAQLGPGGSFDRLADLGGGMGASLCGTLAGLRSVGRAVSRFTLVDKDPTQIQLFEQISVPWIRETFGGVLRETVEEDARVWCKRANERPDCIISSYLLCEQNESGRTELLKYLATARRNGAATIVIDTAGRASAYWLNGTKHQFHNEDLTIAIPFAARLKAQVPPKYSVTPSVHSPFERPTPRRVRAPHPTD